jgi:hypothetical protein
VERESVDLSVAAEHMGATPAIGAAQVVKFLVPGRRLCDAGAPPLRGDRGRDRCARSSAPYA